MSFEHFSCGCPFCSPTKISFDGLNWSRRLGIWLLIIVLLLRGSTAASLGKGGQSLHHGNKVLPFSDVSSQKMKINTSEATSCGADSCNCYPIGKCRPCSKFDVGRQLRECLRTGYKQQAYCPSTKQEQYISCHRIANPFETRMFWLFEGSALSVGAIAYAIVYLRQRRMKKMVAMRIQQQINA